MDSSVGRDAASTNPLFYLLRLSESRSSSGSTPSVHMSIRPYVRPSIRNTFGVPSLCNLELQKFSFLFIQTLHNDCSLIEDVHPLFCENFTTFFFILRGVELRDLYFQNA